MKKIINKDNPVYTLMAEYYKFMQDYYEPDHDENEEKYWKDLIDAGNALAKKYSGTVNYTFAADLVIAFILSRQELSRRDAKDCIKNITGIGK